MKLPEGRRAALLAAAIAALAYLPSFAGAFHFDDYNVIVDYPTVHAWGTLFERAGDGVRAVLKASYVLNWTSGLGLFGFHLVNIGLHALNTALLFLIGARLFPAHPRAALVAALLFALHPAQTEAVTYISGRSSSLMASFYLGALLLYLEERPFLSCLLFILALATRETAVTLPVALVLCDAVRGELRLRRQAAHWLVLAMAALALLLVPRYHDLLTYGFSRRSLEENLITQIGGVSYLVLRLVSLRGYNIDPGLPTLASLDSTLALQAALLGALLVLGLASLRRRPWIAFGLLWFFLQLAPTNSIVPRLDVVNDRQLYLACWGLLLALSIQLAFLRVRVALSLSAVIFLLFTMASIARQLDYRDEIVLWEASVRESPWNARAHNNLGYAYQLAGRKADARREYEAALLFDPGLRKARFNLLFL